MKDSEQKAFYSELWRSVEGPPADSPAIRVTPTADGIVLVELCHPPVNILTVALTDALCAWLRWLAVDANTKAVLLTSALPDQFCAGGDLTEVIDPTWDRFRRFWDGVQQLWILLHAYPKPIVTAVTGTAPGMGCALVLSSDYRVMVRAQEATAKDVSAGEQQPLRIGFNEAQFGICVPSTYCELYVDLLGLRRADRMLQKGLMVTADEAVALGMVDLAVDTKVEALEAARAYALTLVKVQPAAFANQRRVVRDRYVKALYTEAGREAEARFMFESMGQPTAQTYIKAYVAQLNKHNRAAQA